jgi:hypothetical protein
MKTLILLTTLLLSSLTTQREVPAPMGDYYLYSNKCVSRVSYSGSESKDKLTIIFTDGQKLEVISPRGLMNVKQIR